MYFPSRIYNRIRLCKTYSISFIEVIDYSLFFKNKLKDARLFATLPRSGFNYCMLTLNIALDLSNGGSGEYKYANGAWETSNKHNTAFDIRCIKRKNEIINSKIIPIYHTHRPAHRVYKLIGSNKIVLLVRNIIDQLESKLFHEGYCAETQNEFLNEGRIYESIDFFNSWGDFISKKRNDILVVKYEDLLRDKLDVVFSICNFWDLRIEKDHIIESLKLTTKERMSEKIPSKELNNNPRVSLKKSSNIFYQNGKELIKNEINKNLKHSFGYIYS